MRSALIGLFLAFAVVGCSQVTVVAPPGTRAEVSADGKTIRFVPDNEAGKNAAATPTDKLAAERHDAFVANGLVAHYCFDGDAHDCSRHDNDAKTQGKVTYVDGVIGKAIRFGGLDTPGYLEVTNSQSLLFSDAATVAFWLKINDAAGQTSNDCTGAKIDNAPQTIIAKGSDRVGFVLWSGADDGPRRTVFATHSHTPRHVELYSEKGTPPRTWVHVAMITGKSGTQIYHDGKLIGSDKRPVEFSDPNKAPLHIGIQSGEGSCRQWWAPLNGDLDDLRVYNRALKPEEVQTLFAMKAWGAQAMR